MLLRDKTCVIVGVGDEHSIGHATARLFAEQGARLVLANLSVTAHTKTTLSAEIEQATGTSAAVEFVQCDVTRAADCTALIQHAIASFGNVDVLVNSAGAVQSGPMLSATDADVDRMIDVNLKGTINLCHAALGHFSEQRGGAIVNLASLAAQRGGGLVGGAHYAAAKGGVLSFTRSIAREFGPLGIRANAICPAMAQTSMLDGIEPNQIEEIISTIPLRRLGTPCDVAGACLFLASELSAFVTGSTIDVNGGLHIH